MIDTDFSEKLKRLQRHYRNNDLVLVGLNDSQGVNTTTLFGKGTLEYLRDFLTSEDANSTFINAFSLMFNKTEHIDYFLESNFSVEDIKDLQVTGMVNALEKAMQDFHMPKFIGKIGYISKLLYRKKPGDNKILLSSTIEEAKQPVIVYSCGANDLMREGWSNPFRIGKDYLNRDKNDNYNYALHKLENPLTIKRVIGRVERNINNILGLNDQADIYTLSLYIPKSMKSEGMDIFNDAIAMYNEELEMLCKKYGLAYVDTSENGAKYNNSSLNFHVSTAGHNALALQILDKMYDRRNSKDAKEKIQINPTLTVYNHQLYDLLINLKHDLLKLEKESVNSTGREAEVYDEKIDEVGRQINVVEKVIMKHMN